jgi:hypothetical protein
VLIRTMTSLRDYFHVFYAPSAPVDKVLRATAGHPRPAQTY